MNGKKLTQSLRGGVPGRFYVIMGEPLSRKIMTTSRAMSREMSRQKSSLPNLSIYKSFQQYGRHSLGITQIKRKRKRFDTSKRSNIGTCTAQSKSLQRPVFFDLVRNLVRSRSRFSDSSEAVVAPVAGRPLYWASVRAAFNGDSGEVGEFRVRRLVRRMTLCMALAEEVF